MSLDGVLMDTAMIGTAVVAHGGIALNRYLLRPFLRNERYNKFSLQLEHIVHHTGQTLFIGIILKHIPSLVYLNSDLSTEAAVWSFGAGLLLDGVKPYIKVDKLQYGQITSNAVGATIGYYFLSKFFFT